MSQFVRWQISLSLALGGLHRLRLSCEITALIWAPNETLQLSLSAASGRENTLNMSEHAELAVSVFLSFFSLPTWLHIWVNMIAFF